VIFKFTICFSVFALFFIHASYSYAGDTVDFDRVFNMKQYESAEKTRAAILKAYPKGSNSCTMLEYLNTNAKKLVTPYELRDLTAWGWMKEKSHQLNPFIDDQGFSFIVDRPHENIDVWRVHVESIGCYLKDIKVRLQYKDKNFVKRRMPFRFEYFEDTSLIGSVSAYYAINSIALEKNMIFEDIEIIFRDAGAEKFTATIGNTIKKLSVMNSKFYPKRKIGNCKPWYISIITNQNGTLFYENGNASPISVTPLPPHCTAL
jgi:hypothetical protein